MTPLRVDFHLTTPMVVPSMPIHLDALLAFSMTEQELELGTEEGSLRSLADNLPIQRHEQDGDWVWQASALIPELPGEQHMRLWTRKTDPYDLSESVASGAVGMRSFRPPLKPMSLKIDMQRGQLKNHFQFYSVRDTKIMSSWCIGDRDAVEGLLMRLSHIGSKRRIGHGKIERIEISEDDRALDLWKLRVLPWREDDRYAQVHAGIRPPYWAPEVRRMAFCPILAF